MKRSEHEQVACQVVLQREPEVELGVPYPPQAVVSNGHASLGHDGEESVHKMGEKAAETKHQRQKMAVGDAWQCKRNRDRGVVVACV